MGKTPDPDTGEKKTTGFTLFATKRILLGAIIIVLIVWLGSVALSLFDESGHHASDTTSHQVDAKGSLDAKPHADASDSAGHDAAAIPQDATQPETAAPQKEDSHATAITQDPAHPKTTAPQKEDGHAAPDPTDDHAAKVGHGSKKAAEEGSHATAGHAAFDDSGVTGVAFVNAIIAPMNHELNERFYGWRVNDIVDVTDNVNNFQLGVLEVTRRTIEVLVERISSTGGSQTFDKDLVRARNNIMINAEDYMLPSAEDSYEEALEALKKYRGKLINGTAYFYGRIDNLIPLLRAFENLLQSCDDQLIRHYEDDGSEVSWFRTDDYFYYAKGVATAMHSILEAVAVDFATAIETRRGTEILHHALEALSHATHIDPIIILDSSPDGILANHRANMAAPISHSRFYVSLLIETLST